MCDVRSMLWRPRHQQAAVRAHHIINQTSHIKHPPTSHIKHPPVGLTLIELLVVIAILTTLVVSAVRVFSPNNDARKIREAARGLQTYIAMTQAKAARTGRPAGIGFQETAAGSGVALEVFQLEVPRGFAGFSVDSRVEVTDGFSYGTGGNGGTKFIAEYDGAQLYDFDFMLTDRSPDLFPPRMFRIGDTVNVGGNIFMFVDDNDQGSQPNEVVEINGMEYLVPDTGTTPLSSSCIWLNASGQLPPTGLKPYKILRQPLKSSEAPFQFPAGVAIDMQGSVVEGGTTPGAPVPNSFNTSGSTDIVNIMFSPTGAISTVYFNGSLIRNVAKLMLLLGRVENGGVSAADFALAGLTADQQADRREKVNWLNLDSRWLAIAAHSGHCVVSENGFVSASAITAAGDDPDSAADQIEAAHAFIHEMKSGGGR